MNKLLKMSFDRMGYTYDYLKDINNDKYSDRYLFKDEDKLIVALQEAKANNRLIVILSDFDIDGISCGVEFYSGLTLLGFRVVLYKPDVNNGYGFTANDIDNILEQWPEAEIILTCDVGITCVDGIKHAKSKGLKVYVTDHHIEPANNRVAADIIVDPVRYDEVCDFKGVCGAYVVYHILRLYAELTGNSAIIHLISHLSLFASLGSVGDLMPVLYDTRNVIKQGVMEFNRLLDCESFDDFFGCSIEMLPNEYINPFIALYYLHFWMLRNNYVAPGDVTDVMYGFTYCPMFNSIKRMGASLDNLYDLFYSGFNEEDYESFYDNAEWLYDLNKQRKALVAQHFTSMFDTENDQSYAPYVFYTNARPGIMGLLAMKAMGVTGTPVMVVADNVDSEYVSGSGRLPKWFDASLMFSPEISDYVTVMGHAAAFGINIKKDRLNDFCEWLYDTVKSEIKRCESEFIETRLALGIDHPDKYPECDYSICTNNDYDVCFECALEIPKYGPYGNGYPEPEFRLFFTKKDVLSYKTMGSDNSHFRAVLPHDITLVYFSGASCYKDFERAEDDHVFCFAGNFLINEFRGDCTLQFKVNSQIC